MFAETCVHQNGAIWWFTSKQITYKNTVPAKLPLYLEKTFKRRSYFFREFIQVIVLQWKMSTRVQYIAESSRMMCKLQFWKQICPLVFKTCLGLNMYNYKIICSKWKICSIGSRYGITGKHTSLVFLFVRWKNFTRI